VELDAYKGMIFKVTHVANTLVYAGILLDGTLCGVTGEWKGTCNVGREVVMLHGFQTCTHDVMANAV